MTVSEPDLQAPAIHTPFSTQSVEKKAQQHNQSVKELTPEEKKRVEELKRIDAEVKRHEQAHKAAAGQFAKGGPSYKYETGPDGKQYAVGGEVEIDTSEVPNDPRATIAKAQQIKRAALAPKDPSSQDRKVAAEASKMEAKARMELAKQTQEEKQLYAANGKTAGFSAQPAVLDLFI